MVEDARVAAVRKFRHELEDSGRFSPGEIAGLTMTFERAYGEGQTQGVRQAKEAVEAVHPNTYDLNWAWQAIDALGGEQ